MNSAIIVAAGKSERMGVKMDKAFLTLGPSPVLAYSLRAFQECADIHSIVLVVRHDQLAAAEGLVQLFGIGKIRKVVSGGATRQDSVAAGFAALDPDTLIVSVHDAARPCVTKELISETIKTAQKHGSGVAATKVTDTVKAVKKGQTVDSTLDRNLIWTVQTPQTFKYGIFKKAFDELKKSKAGVTDEASAVERIGVEVRLVQTAFPNIKITTTDDLPIASLLLGIK